MGSIEAYKVKFATSDVQELGSIVLNETSISRTVFYATLNQEGVHGKIVYEKKDADGQWVYEKDLDKTKVRQGQWTSVDLKSAELKNLISFLKSISHFDEYMNLVAFNHYIFIDTMTGLTDDEMNEINKTFSNGTMLMKNIAKLSRENKIDLIEKIAADNGVSASDIGVLLDNLNSNQIEETRLKINIVQLNNSIELLEELINKDAKEEEFQDFFKNNEYVLTIAIPSIIHVIDEKPYCGGKGISGNGGSFGDFLCKEANNTVFIEIKTPSCNLVLDEKNRNGINKVSNEIVNAVIQVKYQKDQFYKEWARDSKWKDSFFDSDCYVIAGSKAKLNSLEKVAAFELFKKSLSRAMIITYDELLDSLKRLKSIITE